MRFSDLQIDKFTMHYLAAAFWSSTDDNDEPFDRNYDFEDLAPEALQQAISDCTEFQKQAENALDGAATDFGYDPVEQAGHDFWLTRNGHGAGFWDRGIERYGDVLSKLAEEFGEVDMYLGDDKNIYFT